MQGAVATLGRGELGEREDLDVVQWPKCFPGGSDGKASACNAGDLGLIPGSGTSLGEGNDTHFSIFAWKIPWTEEPTKPKIFALWPFKEILRLPLSEMISKVSSS